MKTLFITLSLSLALCGQAFAESGCEGAVSTASKGNDVRDSALVGAAVGGLIGGLFGSKRNKTETGAIGAVIGGALGAGVGNEAKQRRDEYQGEAAYLDCEIAYTEEQITLRKIKLAENQASLVETRNRVEDMKAFYAQGKVTQDELSNYRATIEVQKASVQIERDEVQQEISRLNILLARPVDATAEDVAAIEQRRVALTRDRDQLMRVSLDLGDVSDGLDDAAQALTT